jgi:hypothetical protein
VSPYQELGYIGGLTPNRKHLAREKVHGGNYFMATKKKAAKKKKKH